MNIFKELVETLDSISATSKRTEKEDILRTFAKTSSDHEFLAKEFLKAAHDPRINYYIEKMEDLPAATSGGDWDPMGVDILYSMARRELSGSEAKQAISNFFVYAEPNEAELFKRIIERKSATGLGASTINKVFPNHIYVHPYMRCSLLDSKTAKNISFPCYSQLKMDGSYCDIVVTENEVTYFTRQGQVVDYGTDARDNALTGLAAMDDCSFVIQGEVLVLGENGEVMSREVGNGYLNSDDRDNSRVVFKVWDTLTVEDFNRGLCETPYEKRIKTVKLICDSLGSETGIEMVETVECNELADIENHFKKCRSLGHEGTIVKDKTLVWKSHTSKHQLKLKVTAVADLVVTGWNKGEGKHSGMVGSVDMESSCGKIRVAVNPRTDAQRKFMTENIDSLIESEAVYPVIFNDVVSNELNDGFLSLYLPRFETDVPSEKSGRSSADDHDRITHILDAFEFTI